MAQAATKSQSANRRRRDYDRTELAQIFSSPAFTDPEWKSRREVFGRAWYWLPLLMYYTGARIEELAQLRASEVVLSPEGSRYLSILESDGSKDGERTVKMSSSRRMIPLHDDLLARGFEAYVNGLSEGSQLFPALKPCPKGRYSTNFAKRWRSYLHDVVTLDSSAHPAHGFRHTFKTLCREVGITEDVHDAITGHASGGIGRTYGTMPLTTMAAELSRYPTVRQIIESVSAAD